MNHTACTQVTIHDLLRTPAMKKHLTPLARKFGLMGFDIRTKEQKAEDEQRADEYRSWTIRQLASRYDREKIYDEIWSEPSPQFAVESMTLRKSSLGLQLISVHLVPNYVAWVNSMDHM